MSLKYIGKQNQSNPVNPLVFCLNLHDVHLVVMGTKYVRPTYAYTF